MIEYLAVATFGFLLGHWWGWGRRDKQAAVEARILEGRIRLGVQ